MIIITKSGVSINLSTPCICVNNVDFLLVIDSEFNRNTYFSHDIYDVFSLRVTQYLKMNLYRRQSKVYI